jgi:hypothetical protein
MTRLIHCDLIAIGALIPWALIAIPGSQGRNQKAEDLADLDDTRGPEHRRPRDLMVNLDIPVQVPAKEDFKLLPPP